MTTLAEPAPWAVCAPAVRPRGRPGAERGGRRCPAGCGRWAPATGAARSWSGHVVYLETFTDADHLDSPEALRAYKRLWDRLRAAALGQRSPAS
ncbi:Scr1 family TA system antitoxin-like transcriptional regulator [Micromonospora sp. HUAS LYJ1]|uniref:Scr1 family TA system antitoxin-like transcriptional regulator n=1 Tax=Micromonospora sp. HUAS LYJ1 TaxID=3061626 RepID=UPI0026712DCB|nr:Scr1 family TA system antitoxin-like transcriptional regulator [Micromonospora sp. HUAS LYJ1]WKU03319.1 Scr1 family TA system antitoxin-like transcriptional regulator [Micromonospora sp. HUAS LYJ1]